ncbi:ATP-binding protein [Lysinibacillus telephonicus]|uniref:histidine kinase n=1 Tax=Lysinibacillus telephonicus TaxID=1714840 RepID=A0A431UJT8_9BACI|nr:ATP-binding protein [Lysinibacillus telephonicus]RTQ89743.1 PAS domain-containing protein [Lysinibacillus telephonicus]
MVKTVSPIFRKLFQTVKDPLLILNTSCQIESINDFAAQLLNIDKNTKQLPMDEHSKNRWSLFLDKIRSEMGGFCKLNIHVGAGKYQEFYLIGYYHEGKNLIFARISPAKFENNVLETGKHEIYSMFNDITHGILFTNINGDIVDVNDKALQYLQCEKSKIINKQHESIFINFVDYQFNKLQYFANLINCGRASINVSSINQQNEDVYFRLESKLNYKMNLIVTTITDETEKVVLKQKMEQQETLNSIGQMAASIAHEIRNPMTSLKGFVQLLKQSSPDDSQKYLKVMDSELQRMEAILTELLYLSKPKERMYKEISIVQVVEEVVELMLQHALANNIIIKLESYDYYKTKIIGNDNRLKQMLINLVKNAIEVMQNGGTITVKLENLNSGVQISVIDEGPGLSEMELSHLFTPFYTTKETGTGLGLALVKKVIEEHNGAINVESTVGVGTTFKISLPICEESICGENDDKIVELWFKNELLNRLPVV